LQVLQQLPNEIAYHNFPLIYVFQIFFKVSSLQQLIQPILAAHVILNHEKLFPEDTVRQHD